MKYDIEVNFIDRKGKHGGEYILKGCDVNDYFSQAGDPNIESYDADNEGYAWRLEEI